MIKQIVIIIVNVIIYILTYFGLFTVMLVAFDTLDTAHLSKIAFIINVGLFIIVKTIGRDNKNIEIVKEEK